jgi:hypothetical protein
MKVMFLAVVSCGIVTMMSGGGPAMQLETGFGRLPWAISLESVGDCEKVEDRGVIHYCVRRDQAHTLLGDFVPEVLYGFYEDAFFSVFIRVEDEAAYQEIKAWLKDHLGSPETSLDKDGMVSVLRWSRDKVRVELHNDRSIQGFQVVYYYVPIADKAARKQHTVKPARWPKPKLFGAGGKENQEPIRILNF